MRAFNCKTTDTRPLVATLTYADGSPVDLTDATVTFYMGTKIAAGACTVVNAAAGKVSYAWQAGDLDTPGNYPAEFNVSIAGNDTRVPSRNTLTIIVQRAVPGA